MAQGRRHLFIDPKRTPLRSTSKNRKKRQKTIDANTAIIRKLQAELQNEA